ncbi:MAG: glycosyltransferase [Leptolyngbyaceae cyanobacterium CSU_1_3]|nr:glycosyltransferase [Leptolyngbyaceae cyanobacterium CSU_1_3]
MKSESQSFAGRSFVERSFAGRFLDFLNWVSLPVCAAIGLWWLASLHRSQGLELTEGEDWLGLAGVGIIGTWRWSWLLVQVVRGRIYQHGVFTRWRQRANTIALSDCPSICLLVPTYQEKPWITERVFRAIAHEALTLPTPLTLLVTSSSEAENAHIRAILRSIDPTQRSLRLIQQVQTGEGKRKAMAEGLRALIRENLPPDTLIALMDGDSELSPGTLQRCIPFFRLFPKLGALTTDNFSYTSGSDLFAEWFHLRLALRHYHMCSVSLSRKVTCLTGRFALFRSQATLDPGFIDLLENDRLDDWLWGQFKFLSGDDKSSWFWVLRQGYEMLYLPDVVVYNHETISGSLLRRAYENMRRWYGNMLRSNGRALGLGAGKTGWFLWWCLLDQRLSIWTALITPGMLTIALLQGKWLVVALLSAWILSTRPLYLLMIFWGRRSPLKLIHLPLLITSLWSSALIKVWTQMNLSQQKWTNRGSQEISAAGSGWRRWVKTSASQFLLVSQMVSLVMVLLWLADGFNPAQDLQQIMEWKSPSPAIASEVRLAIAAGVIPGDGIDDAIALQKLLDQRSTQGHLEVELPVGEIDLFQPVTIRRGQITLRGQGSDRTILIAHTASTPVLSVQSASQAAIQDIALKGFTLRQHSPQATAKILLENVTQVSIRNLRIEQTHPPALILRNTRDVAIAYLALEGAEADAIVTTNAVNTTIEQFSP